MSFPQPKYSKGDKVFAADVEWREERITCVECEGTGQWAVKTPKGTEFEIKCQSCRERTDCHVICMKATPVALKRTIGSIRIDTNSEHPISYMCDETGIGSGSIYIEGKLYTDENECLAFSKDRADKMQNEWDERAKFSFDASKYIAKADFREVVSALQHEECNDLRRSMWRWGYILQDAGQESIVPDTVLETISEESIVAVVEWLIDKHEQHKQDHPSLMEPLVPQKTM